MSERSYRLWDYTASHAQLVIRAVADSRHPENEDHIFAGVTWLQVPETIVGLTVTAGEPSSETQSSASTAYMLQGRDEAQRPVWGMVVAQAYRKVANERALFDTEVRTDVPGPADAYQFERQLIAALSTIGGAHVEIPRPGGVDAIVVGRQGSVTAIEAKYFRGRVPQRAIRSTVMQLVRAADALPKGARLLVVVGGVDLEWVEELKRHLVTALSAHLAPDAILWNPDDGSEPLRRAIGSPGTAAS